MKTFLSRSSLFVIILFTMVLGAFAPYPLYSQISERVFRTSYKIDSVKQGELSVEIDNLSFFKDNEFTGKVLKGYSLPGLWIQPKAVFYPLGNIKLEAGIYFLRYWGASKYPCFAYQDIANWKGDSYQKGVHVLPFFRAQVALSDHVDIVLGNIYGRANHQLIEPLYNPELNLTADPEAGLQLLYNSRSFDLDVWVNWESFIFNQDTHQEAFTVGLSTKVKFNNPESRVHFYLPVQGLAQHRGGEIDTLLINSVQTLMNGSIGFGTTWNVNHGVFKSLNVEFDATGYYQQAGELWPFGSGTGFYLKAMADIYDFRVKASYWKCDDFISMFGSPFYGAVSTAVPGMTFDRPGMVYCGLEYSRKLGKGYAIGIDVDLYNYIPKKIYDPETGSRNGSSSMSFSAGIYLRINPSFLIKNFY